MNRKLKNTLILAGFLLMIPVIWAIIFFFFQSGKIKEKTKELVALEQENALYDPNQLKEQLEDLIFKFSILDSLLANRKYNVPKNVHQAKFYSFLSEQSKGFTDLYSLNVEYKGNSQDGIFMTYDYIVAGQADFMLLYRVMYAIEQSKELKKIKKIDLNSTVIFDKQQKPRFLLNFNFEVKVYSSPDDRFVSTIFNENDLRTTLNYDIFYPLLRNDIEPNIEELLEVNGAKLLAILPDGIFVMSDNSKTFYLTEGDPVYLGFLTKIDREKNSAQFVINRGGIVEKIELSLFSNNLNPKPKGNSL
ncbi:MAG: hypothetical protein IAE91_10580 [Ignavibacteriaceae bacterium]|nr:hypothetical protein [Ignavibacteriaceae bacterium]